MSKTVQECKKEAIDRIKSLRGSSAGDDIAKALNRIAAALERLADVYLYCNDPEGDEVDAPDPDAKPLPPGYRGMR